MFRRKLSRHVAARNREEARVLSNREALQKLLTWLLPTGVLFTRSEFHGNIKWNPDHLVQQAILWSWQGTRNVTEAFQITLEDCERLKITGGAHTYTTFINALTRYRELLSSRLQEYFQKLAQEVAGRFWRDNGWVLLGFDGSRVTAPRTISNEREFCARNFGKGKTAKYRKKKSQGMRRRKNERCKPQPQVPQVWVTLFWHMRLRLPWSWRLGPSNSSERQQVTEMLQEGNLPTKTLFCGDAGFVGYAFWKTIQDAGGDFLVRVGANVSLLSLSADTERLRGGCVLCWPVAQMRSEPPLRLRLVQVQIGKTRMWMLTNILDRRQLPKRLIRRYYKMRWGIEIEYRGLKQTIARSVLRCRNSARAYVELDWSIRAMAFAELAALREQIPDPVPNSQLSMETYDTADRSLANTMRALRGCMRNVHAKPARDGDLFSQLQNAKVQKYKHHGERGARYRPKNPDMKPLGEPRVRKITPYERQQLLKTAA